MFPDLSTYRVLGKKTYRDDVAERLVNGEFYSNPNQTGGLLEPSPQDEKN